MTTQSIAQTENGAAPTTWRLAGIVLAVAVAAVLIGFSHSFLNMIGIWWRSDTFSHAFLIAPISLYLIWRQRDRLVRRQPQGEPLALVLVLGCALLWLVAHFTGVAVVEQFAAVLALQSTVLSVVGRRVFTTMLFPMAYLLLMVPFGEFLVPPLQDITARFVVAALRLSGIPVYADGTFLQTPTGNFQVAEACAGLRFLIATVALALLFAHLVYRQWWRRLVFMALALVIPIIANGFRAFGIVVIAYLTDNQVAVDVDHIIYGWIFLTLVTVALLGVGMALRAKVDTPSPVRPVESSRLRRPRLIVLAGLAAAGISLVTPVVAAVLRGEVPSALAAGPVPQVSAPWRAVEPPDDRWTPEFPGAPSTRKFTYTDGQDVVDLFIAYYPWQSQDAEVVNPNNRIAPGPDWTRIGDQPVTIELDGEPLTVTGTRITHPSHARRLVLQWYWVAGEMTGGPIQAKLLELWGLVSGRPAAAAIVVAADDDGVRPAAEILTGFLRSLIDLRSALEATGS